MPLLVSLLWAALALAALWLLWLWFLAARSLLPRRIPQEPCADLEKAPRFAVVVPAHNEEAIITRHLEAMRAMNYPKEKFAIYVVADNCTDGTAALAQEAGVFCLVREDTTKQGKGYALTHALEHIPEDAADAFLFLDADSTPEPGYLTAMARHLANGEKAIQGRYEVAALKTWFSRLTEASFTLRNRWCFPAFDAMGISIPLRGSGMCFHRDTIQFLGWESHGLTEDMEMTLRLLERDITISFAADAVCQQYMPSTPEAAVSQRLRWSAGGQSVAASILRKAIPNALRKGQWRIAACLLYMTAPSLSAQLCAVTALALLSLLAGSALSAAAFLLLAAYAGYYLLGFDPLDRSALKAMGMIPLYALWRVRLSIQAALRKPASWIRTARASESSTKGKPLRIAMIGARGVPAAYGGFETCMEEVGSRLAAQGHEITVYCRSFHYPDRQKTHKGMRLIHLPCLRKRSLETLSHTALSVLHALFQRYDVHVVFNAANAPCLFPLRLKKGPICLNTDGLEWKRGKWGPLAKRYYRLSEWLSCKVAHQVITDSQGMREYYEKTYARQSVTIAYGADSRRSEKPELLARYGLEPRSYFLQVTRFEPENNPLLTARAFLSLSTNKKLVLVGGTTYQGQYQEELAALADDRVIMPGFLYDKKVLTELWSHCHAYIHGNEVGGTNPALLQAMAHGCFILARDVNFNREVLGDCGLFFAPELAPLAQAMQWTLDHEEALEEKRIQAVEVIAARYSWDGVARQYEDLCREAASKASL